MKSTLEREFEFYLQHQEEFLGKYDGKLIAIKDENVLGAFDSYLEAAAAILPHHKRGTVLFHQVNKNEISEVAVFHSPNVLF